MSTEVDIKDAADYANEWRPYDVLQIWKGEWLDYSTIRTFSDARYAMDRVSLGHYRIWRNGNCGETQKLWVKVYYGE